jgi:hypothetical protein
MINAALASILRQGRGLFNARFAAARHVHPDLDAGAFAAFLHTPVDELVSAVERTHPDRLCDVTQVAYDAALDLVGQKLAGPGARQPFVETAWRRILPRIPALVASAPGRIIPAVCNAAHQLAAAPGARPGEWIEMMELTGPRCEDTGAFLKLGQVCAWRAGLAHFRPGAIAAAEGLPENLVLGALGAANSATWAQVRQRLLDDPWFDPAAPGASAPVRIVAQVGSFRGFGGLFAEPPTVALLDDRFLVRSAGECWLLTADAFGATLHRASTLEFETAAARNRLPPELQISGSRIVWKGQRFELPDLGEFTSTAANRTTLALTGSLTHSIALLALQ